MPLVIPPGFANIGLQFRHSADPEPWYVTFGIDIGTMGGDLDAIGNIIMGRWDTLINPQMSNEVAVTGCEIVVGQDGGEPQRAFVAAPFVYNGNETTEKLPQNCAMLVRKNTSLGGRRNRGRMFVPGILNEAAVSATGIIEPAALNVLQIQQGLFLDEMNDGLDPTPPLPMVLLHSTGLTPVPEPTPIVSLSVDNVISTQRRRLR